MAAKQANGDGGFLKFNSKPPKIVITSDEADFDPFIVESWQDEGFVTTYIPYNGNLKEYKNTLMHIGDELELSEHYAVIAYNGAAMAALEAFIKPHHHCVALVAYYPTKIPAPGQAYPTQTDLLIHLAGSQQFGTIHKHYIYPDTVPGFAETDLDEYDSIAADLAWSRTLTVIMKAFKMEVDLEPLYEELHGMEFYQQNATAVLASMVEEPCVNHVPTMTGGIGKEDLYRFYNKHFIAQNPPSKIKLISRTMGTDRIVDEFVMSFRHTKRMDWILPDVPPTNKFVQVAMVCVVSVRGGKLDKESLYWDQASVLVQVGLLNPKLVPEAFKQQGLKQLPVYGVETAQKVIDEDCHPSNQLISSWRQARVQPQTQAQAQTQINATVKKPQNAAGSKKPTVQSPTSTPKKMQHPPKLQQQQQQQQRVNGTQNGTHRQPLSAIKKSNKPERPSSPD